MTDSVPLRWVKGNSYSLTQGRIATRILFLFTLKPLVLWIYPVNFCQSGLLSATSL